MAGVAPAEASPSLVERDVELRRLRALTAAAATGRGGAIVLEGPAGIGKTSLVAAASELAAEFGLERPRIVDGRIRASGTASPTVISTTAARRSGPHRRPMFRRRAAGPR